MVYFGDLVKVDVYLYDTRISWRLLLLWQQRREDTLLCLDVERDYYSFSFVALTVDQKRYYIRESSRHQWLSLLRSWEEREPLGASHPRKRNDAQKSDRGEIPMSDGVDKKINGLWKIRIFRCDFWFWIELALKKETCLLPFVLFYNILNNTYRVVWVV